MPAIDNRHPRPGDERRSHRPPVLVAFLFALGLVSSGASGQQPLAAVDVAALSKQAETLFGESKFDEALGKLDEIGTAYGDRVPAELAYNRARTLIAMQRVGEAETLLKTVLARASDPTVKAAAAANLGSIEASRATPNEDKASLEQTMDTLRRAERYFRIANAAHPGDGSSAANIDLIQRRIAALQQEQKEKQKADESKSDQNKDKQNDSSENKDGESSKSDADADKSKDQQKKDQNGNSLANELSDLAKKQQEEADQTKDMSKQSLQSGDEQSQRSQQAKDQQELRDRTEKAKQEADAKSSSQSDQPQSKSEMQNAQQKIDEARKAQEQAEQDLKSGKPEQAQQQQQKAADALRQAAEHAKAAEASKDQQPSQDQQKQQQAQAASKPYDATAAQILDRERAIRDRLRQLQMQRSRLVPVEKDW